MLNKIMIQGRLTRDPELRRTGNGTAVASFALACERDYAAEGQERGADFIDCVAWRQTGEFVSKYFTKGQMALVEGRLQIRGWTDDNGNKRRTAEVVADRIYFCGKKETAGENPAPKEDDYADGGYPDSMAMVERWKKTGSVYQNDYQMLEDDDASLPF